MVYTHGLKPCPERDVGSSPTRDTVKMNTKKFIPFLIWFIASFLVLGLLDSYLVAVNELRFTPRSGFSFDFSYTLQTISGFWIWILGVFVVSYLVVHFASRVVLVSRILLVLLIVATIGVAFLANWVARQPCEGLGCIGISISMLIAELVWIISASAVPLLVYSSFRETDTILKNKKFWLSGVVMLFSLSFLWFFATSPTKATLEEKGKVASEEIQQLYADSSFPIFEPGYLPERVVRLGHEYVIEWGQGLAGAYKEYTRKYLYQYDTIQSTSFTITQEKPQNPISDDQYFQVVYDQYRKDTAHRPEDEFQTLTINGYPAYYVQFGESLGGEVVVFRDGVKIVISLKARENLKPVIPKDEMIKIVESLERVN